MKQGDFTDVARYYHNRPAYSEFLLRKILSNVSYKPASHLHVTEFGAGTGKLSVMLSHLGCTLDCVEPNDNMRREGIIATRGLDIKWHKGSAEQNDIPSDHADLIVMASSFHWCDPERALPEFSRILHRDGSFCCIWNPRHIEEGSVFDEIEKEIKRIVPELRRVSSGAQNTRQWEKVLVSTGHFKDCYLMQCDYEEIMDKERYIGAWKSVNDIQAQAGKQRWEEIIAMISKKIEGLDEIVVPYKIRAWIAKRRQ